jgi:adenosylhomocysteine nucleosidase
VVVASAVLSETGTMAPANGLLPPSPGARFGSLLSLDRVLVSTGEKHQVRGIHPEPPLAVEMETAAVARVADQFGVPWAAVRAVSDTADEALPVDFNRLRAADGDLPVSRVALYAATHPGCIPGLIRLGRNTNTAAEALARFLHRWVSSLPVADNGPGVLE